ncbi:PH domain-containing protein [Companilactobacillus nantensis]|uniref:Membrane protein n=1 Tax=Companilactobacillus nantensis DSM 16982 TaxID=1423774 RepID=A0A0R1WDK0_9LACO|nr:PH domain-containing protein [Companilactobacillus nantensis]KRM15589.1 membrane protein [Companilactobacillus nantensis DSM 16982]GEO64690.1 membrane protein [Companilactobacillus nantensis]
MISKPRKLSPAAILFFFYKDIKDLFIPVAIFALAVFQHAKFWTIIGLIALLVLVITGDVIAYFMFSYQLFDNEIVVKKGLFVKKVNHIPYDRIQNVTANQWFFLKPFKLEELEIETAGHSEGPEVSLVAVSVDFKNELNQYRQKVQHQEAPASDVKDSKSNIKSYSITWRELVRFSLTSPAFLSGLLVILAIYGKVQHSISQQMYDLAAQEFVHLGWIIVAVGMLLIVLVFYIVSVFVLIAKYYHFHLTFENKQFEMQYGFFKTKKTSISQSRIQAVVVKQTLLRRMLHIATVKLVIISNSKKEETEKDIIVMPVIATNKLEAFFHEFFPDIPMQSWQSTATNARTYYYDLRNALIFSLITDVLAGLFLLKISLLWLTIVVILSAAIWLIPAYLNARRADLAAISDKYVCLQNNQITSKNTYFVPKSSIQLLDRRQSIWLGKKGFAHLRLSCRSGIEERILQVKYLPQSRVDNVVSWYKKSSE